jgi:hemerythrin superfamily protein
MNALELLKQDHDKVRQLFKQFESTQDETEHRRLAKTIKSELQIHSHIEEIVFYPAMEDMEDDDMSALVDEALDEHHDVEVLLEEIERLNQDGKELRSKMMELQQKVEHHASEEEHEMFARARELLSQEDLDRLGGELESEKKNYSPMAA